MNDVKTQKPHSTVDRGAGPPVVIIPGILGRWEWMAPTIDALSACRRVLTFSLNDAPLTDPPASMFDAWVRLIDEMLDRAGVESATVIGISFGGLVAIHYAAQRPERVGSLILVSTPSPHWRLDPRSASYLKHPRLAMPFLALRSTFRLAPEFLAAHPRWLMRARIAGAYASRVVRSRLSPSAMAHWVRAWMTSDLAADCARITSPTLLVTGERSLDRVVNVDSTLQIRDLIPHARHVVFPGTGHVGVVTKPDSFVGIVTAATRAS